VRGNFHAQFLEGWTGAIPSGYSVIHPEPGLSLSTISSDLGKERQKNREQGIALLSQ
jgi:hypothetical protein